MLKPSRKLWCITSGIVIMQGLCNTAVSAASTGPVETSSEPVQLESWFIPVNGVSNRYFLQLKFTKKVHFRQSAKQISYMHSTRYSKTCRLETRLKINISLQLQTYLEFALEDTLKQNLLLLFFSIWNNYESLLLIWGSRHNAAELNIYEHLSSLIKYIMFADILNLKHMSMSWRLQVVFFRYRRPWREMEDKSLLCRLGLTFCILVFDYALFY